MLRNEIDQRAVRICEALKNNEFDLVDVLQIVAEQRIYGDFKMTSLFQYVTEHLDLSEDRACTYIKVSRLAARYPAFKMALKKKELCITSAKKLAVVINWGNHKEWIEKAKGLSTRALAKEIAKVRPQTKVIERTIPISDSLYELRCVLSEEGNALLTRALDLLSTQKKKNVTHGETIEELLREFVERHDPLKKAERAMRKQENQAPVSRPGKDETGKRTHTPAPVSHQVMIMTQGQCTAVDADGKRCTQRRWLHRHHFEEVSRGGEHSVENLTMLCFGHHRLVHLRG